MPEDPDTNNVDGFDVTIGVPPDAQVLQIKNGQADFSFDTDVLRRRGGERAGQRPGARRTGSSAIPSLRVTYATLNVNMPPFDNVKVRQAVNYAVDREAIVKILGGELQAVADVRASWPDTMLPEGFDDGRLPVDARRRQGQGADRRRPASRRPIDAGTLYYPEAGVNADIAQQIAVRPQEGRAQHEASRA